jgi:hypothetical protein
MQQVRGTILRVDAPYTGKRDLSVLDVAGKALLTLLLLPFLLPLWIVLTMFRSNAAHPSFMSQVAVRVTSFWVSLKLYGDRRVVLVRDVRVRDGAGQQWLVRVTGTFIAGALSVGDDVTIEGVNRKGTIVFRRGMNHTIRSIIAIK